MLNGHPGAASQGRCPLCFSVRRQIVLTGKDQRDEVFLGQLVIFPCDTHVTLGSEKPGVFHSGERHVLLPTATPVPPWRP
jgi:hypothetical protein